MNVSSFVRGSIVPKHYCLFRFRINPEGYHSFTTSTVASGSVLNTPKSTRTYHEDPFWSLITMATVVSAAGTGTIISLCDSQAEGKDLLEKFGHGPCSVYWKKYEQCVEKDKSKKAKICAEYFSPFLDCLLEHPEYLEDEEVQK